MNYSSTERIIIDKDTGEVIKMDQTKTFTASVKVDKFYMTFIDYISPFFKLKTQSAKDVLIWMCQNAEFNTGKIIFAPAIRKKMCEDLGITTNTISNSLKKLAELNLIDGEQGVYRINPQIFWRGDLKTREELLKVKNIQVTFKLNGEVEEKEEVKKEVKENG